MFRLSFPRGSRISSKRISSCNILSGVPVILGTARHEFRDVTSVVKLVGHGICIEIEGLFFQLLQGLVQLEPGPTSGEGCNKDVGLPVVELVLCSVGRYDL